MAHEVEAPHLTAQRRWQSFLLSADGMTTRTIRETRPFRQDVVLRVQYLLFVGVKDAPTLLKLGPFLSPETDSTAFTLPPARSLTPGHEHSLGAASVHTSS